MTDQPEFQEQLGPQARLQAEMLKTEGRKRELWVLVIFAVAILALGALSFLSPGSFWRSNLLEVKMSPQVLFVVMMLLLVVTLYLSKREGEVEKYRLAYMQQILAGRADQAASMVDPATKVFSRTFLHDLLQGEISRAERNNRVLTLVMCDLNDFKQVNDRYGHLMGDYVLAQVASILKSCVRGSDYVVRYGGDEFLLVLPETDGNGAEIIKRRIQQKVADWSQESRPVSFSVSVSLGLYVHIPGQAAEQDLAEADARMYEEKAAFHKAAVPRSATATQS